MILVTGANGFVGRKIMQLCNNTIAAPSLRDATEDQIRCIIEQQEITAIIHTAAISDIGVCQANPEDSYRANVQLPVNLAKAARDTKLVCFSSDQVYSGMDEGGPYEEHTVKAANIYAQHKIMMEQQVLELCPDAVMLRAEWMYDYGSERPNYLMNVLRAEDSIAFSSRQYRGITYLKEVAQQMEQVLQLPGGAYNFGSETAKSMYEITEEFLALIGKNIRLEDAPPRHNLWMNCEKAKKHGVVFQRVEDGLNACAKDYGLLK